MLKLAHTLYLLEVLLSCMLESSFSCYSVSKSYCYWPSVWKTNRCCCYFLKGYLILLTSNSLWVKKRMLPALMTIVSRLAAAEVGVVIKWQLDLILALSNHS